MFEYHTLPDHLTDALPKGANAHVRWALEPAQNAIVFVHGFGGHPTGTWHDFERFLLDDKSLAKTDIYFFSYDSRRVWLLDSATALRQFLSRLFARPHDLYAHISDISSRFDRGKLIYQSALLVAHSAGAAILRRALLDQCKLDNAAQLPGNREWVSRTRTVLFAPAHTGANTLALAIRALEGLNLGWVEPIVQRWFPVLKDLDPKSKFIENLDKDAREVLDKQQLLAIRATTVVRAFNDQVVERDDFFCDLPSGEPKEKTHREICKPTTDYKYPVQVLQEAIGKESENG